PELNGLYASSLAVVVPSLALEVGPMVVAEAFAHGTPVVGRRRGAVGEYVGAAGILFDRDEEIVPALRRLRDVPRLHERLSAAARNSYAARHTPSAFLVGYAAAVEAARERRALAGR